MHETAKRLLEVGTEAGAKDFTEIAKSFGGSDQSATNWKTRGVPKAVIINAAAVFGVEARWLAEGVGNKYLVKTSANRPIQRDLLLSSDIQPPVDDAVSEPSNIEQAPALRGKVPVISFVQAGEFVEVVDNFQPGEAEEWTDATCPVNRYTFALRVVGDSMEPDFPAGTILIIEPELSPEPNDFVIAKNGDGEATFKQLTKDGGDWYLKPLNSRYPIKPLGTSRIIGVVRDAVRKFR